jgi:hypothetical protein
MTPVVVEGLQRPRMSTRAAAAAVGAGAAAAALLFWATPLQ